MYESFCKTEIKTRNTTIQHDGCHSLFFRNVGNSDVFVFDNILIKPGETYSWDNHSPDVVICDDITIVFSPVENPDHQLLVQRKYIRRTK